MRTDATETTGGADDLSGGGTALFHLVRYWSRRWTAQAAERAPGDLGRVGHILLLEAIDAASHDGSAAIGEVAEELGLDRSNASRMLAEAVSAGLVDKRASPEDARRARLSATASGAQLLESARAWQEQVFGELVSAWPRRDARRFAGYLRRLAAEHVPAPRTGGNK